LASPLFANTTLAAVNQFYRSDLPEFIQSPDEAINLFDFKAAAHKILSPAHFAYLNTGVTDNLTREVNRTAFDAIKLRPRRLVDTSNLDTSLELLGKKLHSPIMLAPVSAQGAFHPMAEVAVASAARQKSTLPIIATFSTRSLGEIRAAYEDDFWFQLYVAEHWEVSQEIIRRAEAAGCTTLVLTIDMFGGTRRDEFRRLKRLDNRDCSTCHPAPPGSPEARRLKPTVAGLDFTRLELNPTWELVSRVKEFTSMNLVVKGVVTAEDAKLALEHGADGMIVSNHGGRAFESGRASIECLPEVVKAVRKKVPVLIDSGFRRGNDVYKAIALGADAVCIGRPYLWGLATFGQAGVEAVLDIINDEFRHSMQKMGTRTLADITPASIATA
jgi:isopentenyl diphosphate isomerase/L-lactate dehydrogenase-like FMN-dependent dehydrogenase